MKINIAYVIFKVLFNILNQFIRNSNHGIFNYEGNKISD